MTELIENEQLKKIYEAATVEFPDSGISADIRVTNYDAFKYAVENMMSKAYELGFAAGVTHMGQTLSTILNPAEDATRASR